MILVVSLSDVANEEVNSCLNFMLLTQCCDAHSIV